MRLFFQPNARKTPDSLVRSKTDMAIVLAIPRAPLQLCQGASELVAIAGYAAISETEKELILRFTLRVATRGRSFSGGELIP